MSTNMDTWALASWCQGAQSIREARAQLQLRPRGTRSSRHMCSVPKQQARYIERGHGMRECERVCVVESCLNATTCWPLACCLGYRP